MAQVGDGGAFDLLAQEPFGACGLKQKFQSRFETSIDGAMVDQNAVPRRACLLEVSMAARQGIDGAFD
jgi:hypothetical protein